MDYFLSPLIESFILTVPLLSCSLLYASPSAMPAIEYSPNEYFANGVSRCYVPLRSKQTQLWGKGDALPIYPLGAGKEIDVAFNYLVNCQMMST